MSIKRLHLLAGPNGAGKSTFVNRILRPMTGLPFVNADVTVFSHSSKVALVQDAAASGYKVYLYVIMVPVDVTVGRVGERVRRGGHSVSEEKIRQRYDRLWGLIVRAREFAVTTDFYDNSDDAYPYRHIASYHRGVPVGNPRWPRWVPQELL